MLCASIYLRFSGGLDYNLTAVREREWFLISRTFDCLQFLLPAYSRGEIFGDLVQKTCRREPALLGADKQGEVFCHVT